MKIQSKAVQKLIEDNGMETVNLVVIQSQFEELTGAVANGEFGTAEATLDGICARIHSLRQDIHNAMNNAPNASRLT